ncbi:MAG: hypothetical protein ACKOB1_12750, partial [Planctomycetia bacterium]
ASIRDAAPFRTASTCAAIEGVFRILPGSRALRPSQPPTRIARHTLVAVSQPATADPPAAADVSESGVFPGENMQYDRRLATVLQHGAIPITWRNP